MHGSSSVPQELLEIIRQYGGDMKETYGVPVEEIVQGIKYGVRKINIDTDIRLAMTGAVRKFLAENPPSSIRASSTSPRAKPPSWCARPASKPSAAPAWPARSSRSRSRRWPHATRPAT